MKGIFFAFLCFQMWVGSEMNFFIVPVFPVIAQKFNITGTLMGLILVFYGAAQVCSSITMMFIDFSKIKFHLFFMCTSLLIIGNLCFAFLENLNFEAVLFFSFLGRIIHGTAEGVNLAVGFSLIAEVFPDQVAKYIAIFESFNALVFVISPIFSGFLSEFTGYMNSYLIISLIFLPSFFLIFYFSKRFKEIVPPNNDIETVPLTQEGDKKAYVLGTFKLLKKQEILLVLFMFAFHAMSCFMPDAGIYNHVKDIVGGNKFYLGTMLSTACFGTLIATFAFSYFIGKTKRKTFFIIGTSLIIIYLLILGPEPYIFLEMQPWTIYLAFFIGGCSIFFASCAILPDFIETIRNETNIKNDIEIQDRASSLLSFGFSLGNIMGSLFGGIYIDIFGFTRAMTFQAGFILIYTLIFAWRKKNV